jgi:hypothetical protein
MWNGKADILNKIPHKKKKTPTNNVKLKVFNVISNIE